MFRNEDISWFIARGRAGLLVSERFVKLVRGEPFDVDFYYRRLLSSNFYGSNRRMGRIRLIDGEDRHCCASVDIRAPADLIKASNLKRKVFKIN